MILYPCWNCDDDDPHCAICDGTGSVGYTLCAFCSCVLMDVGAFEREISPSVAAICDECLHQSTDDLQIDESLLDDETRLELFPEDF